ncbi:hypothetical protein M413DRAFT_447822 [Hebeloma cylindrosporum]|uniref:Uncharacterized protein n=1 Tax=Hebeloma cylindrosporum TaxID=76867 RepID=A0A0C3C210_HEBCY|nr:hypothetical protein M413DRAFT_447822 [Hebeloma cylindrosporum h7]
MRASLPEQLSFSFENTERRKTRRTRFAHNNKTPAESIVSSMSLAATRSIPEERAPAPPRQAAATGRNDFLGWLGLESVTAGCAEQPTSGLFIVYEVRRDLLAGPRYCANEHSGLAMIESDGRRMMALATLVVVGLQFPITTDSNRKLTSQGTWRNRGRRWLTSAAGRFMSIIREEEKRDARCWAANSHGPL